MFALIAAWVLWRTYWSEPKSVGFSPLALHFDWGGRQLRVSWENVEPAFLSSRWSSYPVFYRAPGRQSLSYVFLTENQARALLRFPSRPGWPVDSKVERRLGLAL